MELFTYDITSKKKLYIGRQYEHNALTVTFSGFTKDAAEDTVYLLMDEPVEAMIPLTDGLEFTVQSPYTQTVGLIRSQLAEYRIKDGTTDTMELIKRSPVFYCQVAASVPDEPEKEVTDPRLDLVYAQMHEAYLKMLEHEETAEAAAEAAAKSEANAKTSETNAAKSETNAKSASTSASESMSMANAYAEQASEYVGEAQTVLTQVQSAGKTAVKNVNAAQTTATDAIASAQTTATNAVQSAQTTAVSVVNAKETEALNAIDPLVTKAETGASTATTKAGEASTSASEAAGSATAAEQSATDAEAAKADLIKDIADNYPKYDEVLEDVSQLKDDLSLYAMHIDEYGHMYINTEE